MACGGGGDDGGKSVVVLVWCSGAWCVSGSVCGNNDGMCVVCGDSVVCACTEELNGQLYIS